MTNSYLLLLSDKLKAEARCDCTMAGNSNGSALVIIIFKFAATSSIRPED